MLREEQVIAEVFGLYERFGDSDYIGEPVSQIEHMSHLRHIQRFPCVDHHRKLFLILLIGQHHCLIVPLQGRYDLR